MAVLDVLRVYGDIKASFFTEISLKNIFFPILDDFLITNQVKNVNQNIQEIINRNNLEIVIQDANAILNQQNSFYFIDFLLEISKSDNQSDYYNMTQANLQFMKDYSNLASQINVFNTITQKLTVNVENKKYTKDNEFFKPYYQSNKDIDYLNNLNFNQNPDLWTIFNNSEIPNSSKNIINGVFVSPNNYFDNIVVNALNFLSSIDLDNRWFFGTNNYINYQTLNEDCLYFKVYAYIVNNITKWIELANQMTIQWKEKNSESIKSMFLSLSIFQQIANTKLINYYNPIWLDNSQGLIDGVNNFNAMTDRLSSIFTNAVANDNINNYIDIEPELQAIKKDFAMLDFPTPNSLIIEDLLYISELQNKSERVSKTTIEFLSNYYGIGIFENLEPIYDYSDISKNMYLAQNLIRPDLYTYNAALGVWILNYKENPVYGYDTPKGQADYDDIIKVIQDVLEKVEETLEYFLTKVSCFINNFNCIINLIVSIVETIESVLDFINNVVDGVVDTFNSTQNELIGLWNDIVVGGIMGQQNSISQTVGGLLADPTQALNCIFNTIFSDVLLTVNNFPNQITQGMQNFLDGLNNQLPNEILQIEGCKMSFRPPQIPDFNLNIDLGKIKVPDIINGVIDINVDMDCNNGAEIDIKHKQV